MTTNRLAAVCLAASLLMGTAPTARAFTQPAGEWCFSCEGSNPVIHVPPIQSPPDITERTEEDTEASAPAQVAGFNLVAPFSEAAAIGAGVQYAVTISHTADLAEYDAFEFSGAGTSELLFFGNFVGIAQGALPYFPPFPAGDKLVDGYQFLSYGGGPNFKAVHIPTVWIREDRPDPFPIDMPVGDGEFLLWVDNVAYDFNVNETFDLTAIDPAGVESFAITGFDASEGLQTNSPLPFVYGLQFMAEANVQTVVLPLVPVPEPSTFSLALAGLLFVTRRR